MATPSHAQMTNDAELIASAAVRTILGTFSPGIAEGIKLKGAYGRFVKFPELKDMVVQKFAAKLSEEDHGIACRLCDALQEKVGE